MGSNYEKQLQDVEERLGSADPARQPETTKQEVLPELTGKTVERTGVVRQDPEVFGDVLYVFFTDGSTLKLEAGMSDLYGLMKWKVT